MKQTTLGRGGPTVSRFGIGAMSFAGIYGDATEEESHAVLDTAAAAGVTHIDTSNVYGAGRSEEIVGSWLKANPGAMTVATKAGIHRSGDRRFDNSRAHMEGELEKSLLRLGLDAVDLFYVHRRDPDVPIEEIAGTMGEIVKAGKAKTIGFSEIAPTTLRRAAAVHSVAAVQSEYSLSTRFPELGLVQACEAEGALLVAFSPVGRAFLTDRPFSYDRAQANPFLKNNPRFMEPNYSANIAATDRFRDLAAEMGEPTAALAIAWLLSRGEHVLPIPGTKSVSHLKELLRGTELRLSEGDLARIEEVLPVGWAHGDRYSEEQWKGPERYC